MHYPLIEIKPKDFSIPDLASYSAIVFTSKNAAQAFFAKYNVCSGQKIISIGTRTSKEISKYASVDHQAAKPDSDSLLILLRRLRLKKVLYPTSQLSDNVLHKEKNITKKVIYETRPIAQTRLDLADHAGIIFSSGSTVDAFFKLYKKIPKHFMIYTYGAHTSRGLARRGYKNVQALS
ncbi:MAG: uroporphyrinogen-III synthase [Candidatus Margulisiibacteriota bacterium]